MCILNFAVCVYNSSVVILNFADAIKVFEDGNLHTLGILDYDKRLDHYFTSHPKIDPYTGKSIIFT
jgi:carotenoid 9,10(9',10')-cleavage dioxygenase 1